MNMFVEAAQSVHTDADAQKMYLALAQAPLSSDASTEIRHAAAAYMDAGDFQKAALTWGILLHRFPDRGPLLNTVLRCMVEVKEVTWLSVCIPTGILSEKTAIEIAPALNRLLTKLWHSPSPANAVLQNMLLWDAAKDDAARALIARYLTVEQAMITMQHRLQSPNVTAQDAMSAAHVFNAANVMQVAKVAFDHACASLDKLSFEDTLLGCQIAACGDDRAVFAKWQEQSRALAKTAPDKAAESYVFHLMFPKLAGKKTFMRTVQSTRDSLHDGSLTLANFWGTARAIASGDTVAVFLRHLAQGAPNEHALNVLASIADKSMSPFQIAAHCKAQTWNDSTLTSILLEQCIKQVTTLDDLSATLEALEPLSPKVISILREHATQLRVIGDNKLAGHLWVAILTANPSDEWAYTNAITMLIHADETALAQKVAQDWDTSKLQGQILAFAGMAFARIGLSDKARDLLLRAARQKGVEHWPVNHKKILAQGLILYGEYDQARSLFPPQEQPTVSAKSIIVDPGHSDGPGHHATYNIFFSEFVEAADGVLPEIAVSLEISQDSLQEYKPNRCMIFQPYAYNAIPLRAPEIAGLNKSFRDEMAHIFEKHIPQTIIVHSMRGVMLGGFADWLSSLGRRRPKTVIIGLIEADHLADQASSEQFSNVLKTSLGNISRLKVKNLILFAETAQAVDWLQERIPATTIHKLPYLAAGRAIIARSAPDHTPSRPPVFGITGGTRRERGFEHIFKAILESKSGVDQWLVQVNPESYSAFRHDPLYNIENVAAAAPERVTFIKGSLTDAEYYEALSGLDCLVLPYSGRYAVSGSGVLYEAIYSRKYIIVSSGSTLASELGELGYPHQLIKISDPQSLITAVDQTLANWPNIAAQITQFFEQDPVLPLEKFQSLYTQNQQAGSGTSGPRFIRRASAFSRSIVRHLTKNKKTHLN